MKRSITSISNNRDAIASQSKRIRSATVSKGKENGVDINNNQTPASDQEKSVKKVSQSWKSKTFYDNAVLENHSSVVTKTPSSSTISFSSPSPSSSLANSSVSTTNNKKPYDSANESLPYQQNNTKSTHRYTNKTVDRTTNPGSQPILTALTSNKSRMNTTKSLTQTASHSQSSNLRQPSSLNHSAMSLSSNDAVSALVEGSLEYRELKRLYQKEKSLAEEWRKDYQVLKGEMTTLKSSTIPRPTAEVLEWLRELFDLMDNNGAYVGDGRTLEQIGEDLGVDAASLITVVARTPQKSALKLFRLLYPTVGSRAKCQSIAKIPREQMNDIYMYVRTLHRSLSFSTVDMRRAIGTSIRSATSDLRRMEDHREQRSNNMQNNNSFDTNETDEQTQNGTIDDADEEDKDDDEIDENEDDEDKLDDENEDDEDTNPLMIDDEDSED